jgi:hypothetical protein
VGALGQQRHRQRFAVISGRMNRRNFRSNMWQGGISVLRRAQTAGTRGGAAAHGDLPSESAGSLAGHFWMADRGNEVTSADVMKSTVL